MISRRLPLAIDNLVDLIKIIFVGKSLPPLHLLKQIFTVRRENVCTALRWLKQYNELYRDVDIDESILLTLPDDEIPACLANTITLVDEKDAHTERSGYTDNATEDDTEIGNDNIALLMSAMVDTRATTTSSDHINRHLLRSITQSSHETRSDDEVYLIPHGNEPLNEYFNSKFLPGIDIKY